MTLQDTAAVGDRGLAAVVERHLPDLQLSDEALKTALPGIARSSADSARVAAAVQEVPSDHRIVQGDARATCPDSPTGPSIWSSRPLPTGP